MKMTASGFACVALSATLLAGCAAPPAPNRNPRTVAFVEERSIDPRTFVSLRVRKTF